MNLTSELAKGVEFACDVVVCLTELGGRKKAEPAMRSVTIPSRPWSRKRAWIVGDRSDVMVFVKPMSIFISAGVVTSSGCPSMSSGRVFSVG